MVNSQACWVIFLAIRKHSTQAPSALFPKFNALQRKEEMLNISYSQISCGSEGILKRVEAYISSEKGESVLSALESSNFQATFFESKGMGKGEKRELSFKGRTMKMKYSTRSTIVTIVDDDKLDQVISVIKSSGSTGTTSSGVIVVSPVDELVTL